MSDDEEWRPIPDWTEYEASSLGRVRRIPGRQSRQYRVLREGRLPTGYLLVVPCESSKPKTQYVHRLVCAAFHGRAPSPKHDAAHGNGRRDDNRPDNLRWATRAENTADMRRHGTARIGRLHHNVRLTEDDVRAIRERAAAGDGRATLAEAFKIRPTHVWQITTGRRWRHLSASS